ncbi:MAG: GNAT family N-acetyltransferase [Pseudomonadota bacterium]
MHIREATPSDLEAIAQLHTRSWRSAYRGMLSDAYLDGDLVADRRALWQQRFDKPAANQTIAVMEADDNKTMVGLACAFGDHDARWGTLLENLHVAQEYKGKSLGAQLVDHIAAWCARTQTSDVLHLWVLAPNIAAQGFYKRLGASEVEQAVWDTPDGNRVSELRFAWPSVNTLLQQRQSPAAASAERTTP